MLRNLLVTLSARARARARVRARVAIGIGIIGMQLTVEFSTEKTDRWRCIISLSLYGLQTRLAL